MKTRLVVLYRGRDFEEEEQQAAKDAGFFCTNSRMDLQAGDIVVPRYSALPFYLEQQRDMQRVGARLINSYSDHQYVADMQNWYEDLSALTPKTWFRLQDVPKDEAPFVLKGETNSKKFDWNGSMFAKTWEDAGNVYYRLTDDGLVGTQSVYIRKYVALHTYMTGFRGLPITKEFRFFCYKGRVLSSGFYWSSHAEDIRGLAGSLPEPSEVPETLVRLVLAALKDKTPFVVVDFAQTQTGDWIVVELNDGSMSGLSENNPETLYRELATSLRAEVLD